MSLPSPNTENGQASVATLAGGCFWCLDAVYRQLRGVKEVVSGYTGGHVPNPDYYSVGSGETGHAACARAGRLAKHSSTACGLTD